MEASQWRQNCMIKAVVGQYSMSISLLGLGMKNGNVIEDQKQFIRPREQLKWFDPQSLGGGRRRLAGSQWVFKRRSLTPNLSRTVECLVARGIDKSIAWYVKITVTQYSHLVGYNVM
jgi:hypothetical protein